MRHLWRRHLGNDTDVLMTITSGDHFWGKSQHKPLILAIILHLLMLKIIKDPGLHVDWISPNLFRGNLNPASRSLVAGTRKNFLTWTGSCVG